MKRQRAQSNKKKKKKGKKEKIKNSQILLDQQSIVTPMVAIGR